MRLPIVLFIEEEPIIQSNRKRKKNIHIVD